jgi:aminomethyltransferase
MGRNLEAGQAGDLGLTPVGLGARDVLRLEASMPLYGHELSAELSPLQAGAGAFYLILQRSSLHWKRSAAQQKEEGLKQKLAGLELLERGVLREGYRVVDGETISAGSAAGRTRRRWKNQLGWLFCRRNSGWGSEVQVIIRGRAVRARVVKLPFYRRGFV